VKRLLRALPLCLLAGALVVGIFGGWNPGDMLWGALIAFWVWMTVLIGFVFGGR
jgi:hypothetical protein